MKLQITKIQAVKNCASIYQRWIFSTNKYIKIVFKERLKAWTEKNRNSCVCARFECSPRKAQNFRIKKFVNIVMT